MQNETKLENLVANGLKIKEYQIDALRGCINSGVLHKLIKWRQERMEMMRDTIRINGNGSDSLSHTTEMLIREHELFNFINWLEKLTEGEN